VAGAEDVIRRWWAGYVADLAWAGSDANIAEGEKTPAGISATKETERLICDTFYEYFAVYDTRALADLFARVGADPCPYWGAD